MTSTQEKLIEDVAAQAGLVLRNVALIADLKDSRRRIVAAQDERARSLVDGTSTTARSSSSSRSR